MGTITKKALLFEEFIQEKEYTTILENINESIDPELAEKFKILETEKEAAEAINALIDSNASLEEFFATMATMKQEFKIFSGDKDISPELRKALNRMTDHYVLYNKDSKTTKNLELAKRIISKTKKSV